jgi:hypothetical protein
MLELGLHSLLGADAGVIAAVSARIYPLVLPSTYQGESSLTYHMVSGSSALTLDSASWDMKRIHFDAWSGVYADTRVALRAVKALLHGFSGALPDGTYVNACCAGVPSDYFEEDARIYRGSCEYTLYFREA